MTIILFLFTAVLQTALITWQHFSPFERESNLRAVLWGANPAPRYWAVVALDVCTTLLVFLLVLSVWPQHMRYDLPPLTRIGRMLPIWVLLLLAAAVAHHFVTEAVIPLMPAICPARFWAVDPPHGSDTVKVCPF